MNNATAKSNVIAFQVKKVERRISKRKVATLIAQILLVVGIATYALQDFAVMESKDFAFQQQVVDSYGRKMK